MIKDTYTQDDYKFVKRVRAYVAPAFGSQVLTNREEGWKGDAVINRALVTMTMRYDPVVKTNARVLINGEFYEVIGAADVDNRGRYLVLRLYKLEDG